MDLKVLMLNIFIGAQAHFMAMAADNLHHAVNNRRDYPNVGDLKFVMREARDVLRCEHRWNRK